MEDFSRLAGCHRRIPEQLLYRARELRQQQTPAAQILWSCLRGRRLSGAKFRRQHNIGWFIADFYCHEAQLVIELDGAIHQSQVERDAEREAWMQANGLTVLRFANASILDDLPAVLTAIDSHLLKSFWPRERDLE